ncbi:hypothetical protein B0J12DRAFT_684910 [Macrophomina phaseolina]|uniref:FAD dependent oxidoreductase domain-containing protein n=1 Tax=Macrophomina phaseolina TaxID=35725 RepID=A0ABQ8FU77_9PEZI|nr:hypothetical protein B0J12DRAFT_684910 [Macrophomina phaseolina]
MQESRDGQPLRPGQRRAVATGQARGGPAAGRHARQRARSRRRRPGEAVGRRERSRGRPTPPRYTARRAHPLTRSRTQEFGAAFNALGAVSYPAAALWPSRFVAAVFRQLLDAHPGRISIETHTPATAVELLAPGAPRPFRVVTPRGAVAARHVVHATNAFAPHLVPGLRGKLTGCRAHMTAQRPGPGFPGTPKGDRSWGLIHAKGFDYMTQRPCPRHARATPPSTGAGGATGCGHGDLLLGGGLFRSGEGGMDQIGVWDDGGLDALSVAHLHGILPALAAVGAGDGAPAVAQAGTAWSGTIALTADALPLVGRLDERFTGRRQQGSGSNAPGEWIAAGYNGEGMVFAWLCGAAAARMVAGTDEDSLDAAEARLAGQPPGKVADWLPHELRISWERLEGKSLADLAGALSV